MEKVESISVILMIFFKNWIHSLSLGGRGPVVCPSEMKQRRVPTPPQPDPCSSSGRILALEPCSGPTRPTSNPRSEQDPRQDSSSCRRALVSVFVVTGLALDVFWVSQASSRQNL